MRSARAAVLFVRVGGAAVPCVAALAISAASGCKKGTPPPSLGESVSVEQRGGAATELIERGSEIPTSATESFTTVRDGERRLAVHVVRGAGRSAAKLRSEGWWVVDGVSAAPAGQPRVLVTFDVDAQGALSVSAREGDRKLKVAKMDDAELPTLAPAPLAEPDEDDDADADEDAE